MEVEKIKEQEEEPLSVLDALDKWKAKFEFWLPETMQKLGAKPQEVEDVKKLLSFDSLSYVPKFQEILNDYHGYTGKKTDFIRTFLPPAQANAEIPIEILEKGCSYLDVLDDILNNR